MNTNSGMGAMMGGSASGLNGDVTYPLHVINGSTAAPTPTARRSSSARAIGEQLRRAATTARPAMTPCTPRPWRLMNDSTGCKIPRRSVAAVAIAFPKGNTSGSTEQSTQGPRRPQGVRPGLALVSQRRFDRASQQRELVHRPDDHPNVCPQQTRTVVS